MSVLAHTSKIGYHELKYRSRWYYGPVYTSNPNTPYGTTPVSGISYRSALVKADGRKATSYSRCTGRILPGKGGTFKTSLHKVRADDANIVQMCSLNAYGGACNLPVGEVYIPEYLEGAAINQALTEISQVSSNVLEDLAQARQVVDMAVDIYQRIWDLCFIYFAKGRRWRSLRGYLLHQAKNAPKVLGDAWLFYYYGIKPLVSTFNQVVKQYRGGTYHVKGKGKRSDSVPISLYATDGSAGVLTGTAERGVICELHGSIKCSSNLLWWRGLGLSGPDGSASNLDALVTLWAIQPYSFVFDWFIPVETWLRTLYWAPEVDYQVGWISRRIKGQGECEARYFSGNLIKEGDRPRCSIRILYFQRVEKNSMPPLGRLYLNVSLRPNQLFSAAALIGIRG